MAKEKKNQRAQKLDRIPQNLVSIYDALENKYKDVPAWQAKLKLEQEHISKPAAGALSAGRYCLAADVDKYVNFAPVQGKVTVTGARPDAPKRSRAKAETPTETTSAE